MKNRLLPCLLFFAASATLFAQNGQPFIAITGTATCQCDGCFFVTVENIQPPYTLLWSNGMVSTGSSPLQVCGFCPGQYSVTVTNNNPTLPIVTTTGYINPLFFPVDIIAAEPTPCNNDSTASQQDCDRVCAGSTTTYTISGNNPGGGGLLNWQVSGATSWTVNPPPANSVTITWGNPGSGSIEVFSDSGQSCLGEAYKCITIIDPPAASIGTFPAAPPAGNLQVCKGQTVDFQNLSTGDADYFEWLFSDDFSASSLPDPKHTFLTAGTHTVTLIASSLCLCSDTTTLTIEVLDAEAPTLDCVGTVCPGATVTYAASNACAPFVWSVSSNGVILEGGTPSADSITVQWVGGPDGVISLNAAACVGATCPLAGLTYIPIISDQAEIRGESRVCPGSSEVYSIDPFGGSGFVWTLSGGGQIVSGQGTNRVNVDWQTFANANATYWLVVEYTNCYLGCGGRDSIPVTIVPFFTIAGPVEACVNATSTFTSKFTHNNAAINCNWSLDDPTGATIWTSPTPTATVNIPYPQGVGTYRLYATPDNPNQTCSDRADWVITVKPVPAKLTGIKGERRICPGLNYTYEAEGGDAQSNYLWTVQNGASGPFFFPGKNLNVVWNNSGPRWLAVSQVSADGLSCFSDTIQLQLSAIGIPQITGVPALCEDTEGSYSIAPLETVNLQWSVTPAGAGAVSNGQGTEAADIYWSQSGVHQVNLNVCGQTASFSVTVHDLPAPTPIAPAGLCPGETGAVQTSAPFDAYNWLDADGNVISSNAIPDLQPGNYAVEVTDANGCVGTESFEILAWEVPDVSLTTASPTGFCNNELFVPLTALTNGDGNYTFEWYQDGVLIPGQTTATYSTNQYAVYTILVTNGHGCTATAGPLRLFEYCGGGGQCTGQNCAGDLCPPGTVSVGIDATARCDSFQLHLLDPNGTYVPGTANWVFGISGGLQLGSSTDTDPTVTFGNAGEYAAVVTVQLIDGNWCNVYDFMGVEAVARINSNPACPGDATALLDVSEFLPSGGIASWNWTMGDPASGANNVATDRNPTHVYAATGNYTVQLTVTGTSGCTSSATAPIDIPLLPDVNFAEPAFKCAGNALEFNIPANAASITDIQWDFGDPASGASNDATTSPAFHTFSPAGTYTVTATATNVYGCTTSFARNIIIPANSLTGTITPANPPAICEGGSISLGAPAGAVSYIWSDDAQTTTPFLTVTEEGTFHVTLTDANGCTYAPPAVKVEENPAPDALIKALLFNDFGQVIGVSYPTLTVCEGEDVVLQAVSNSSFNYSWSVSNGNNPFLSFTEDRNNLLAAGTYTYAVTVTNPATGCTTVTTPFTVIVHPKPSGFSISGTSICADVTNVLTYNGPQPANWQLLWNTGASGPSFTTETPGSYYVRVVNEFGCEQRSNTWTVLPGPPINAIPAGCFTRCKPDTLCLPGLPTVVQWQWFMNGTAIPGATSPQFIAQQSGAYWVEMTDYYGCKGTSESLSLNLYDGHGNILGEVWSDVNNNGIIDAADTLVSGIPVLLFQNGTAFDAANSGVAGNFAFPNVLSTNYTVEIDAANLPAIWDVVIGQAPVSLSGCDVVGVAALLIDLNCQVLDTLEIFACAGETIDFQGVPIAAGGNQVFQFTNNQGCDSLLLVQVITLPVSTGSAVLFACPGGSANYNGTAIPAGTTQNFTLTNAAGCDSIVTVTVTPLAATTSNVALQACPGGSANYNGTAIPVGATQNFTLTNAAGCDSIVTVTVAPLAATSGNVALFACVGGSANYNGTDIPAGSSQNFTLTNAAGCDSIVTVNVQAWPNSTGSATLLFACAGGAAEYNGTSIPAGTSQQFTLQNWLGCDSVVTVSVAALPAATGAATLYACPGGAATYNGTSIPVGTSQNFTLQNWLGCDSIVTINVAAWNATSGAATLYACPGSAATYNGVSVPVGTSQNFTLQNWLGCDSIVTVNVAAWATSSSGFSVGVCPGETYTYQGTSLNAGAVQPFVLQNWLGCDSTVTVTVTSLQPSSLLLPVTVCQGKTFPYNGTTLTAGESRDFFYQNAVGCDSTVTIVVTELPAVTFNITTESACATTQNGSLEAITAPGGTPPFQYALDPANFQNEQFFDNLAAGAYNVYVQDAAGCQYTQPAVIPAIPSLNVTLPNVILPCDSAGIMLSPTVSGGDTATLQFKWWNGSTSPTAMVSDAGPVWLEVSDVCSMERSEALVTWADLAQDLSIVYVPNIMKPAANNPENARFQPLFAAGIDLISFKFMVFDRWGNELFETQTLGESWDGVFDGQPMNPGVQVWYLEADVAICGRILHVVKKGDVTILR